MIRRLLSGWRHPVRLLAMAMAALSLAWGVALTEGLIAAMAGAALGVIAGELLGRSRLRTGVVLGGLWLFTLVAWKGGAFALTTEWLADYVGPGNALAGVGVVRFGTLAFSLIASLRAVAVRRPAALALELGFIAAALTGVFASHRDGVIARPLWLSDWAWQQGIDPSQVFLVIGAVAVGLLAILLVAETKSGRALSSLAALAGLALLAVMFINVVGAPTPHPESVLGLTDAGQGEPPRPTRDGGHNGPQPDEGDGGSGDRRDRGDGGSQGGDAGEDGGGSQSGDAGDGGGAGGGDAGDGGSSAGGDAGDGGASGGDGGDGGSSSADDAGDGGSSGGDGGLDVSRPMYPTDGSVDPNVPPPQDGSVRPPSEQFNDDNQTPSQSPAPMAVVQFDNDYTPPSGAYYFREDAWSQFNGVRLVSTTRNDVDLDLVDEFPTMETRVRDVAPDQGRTRVAGTITLLLQHEHPFGLEGPVSYAPVLNPNSRRFVRAYRFSSVAQTVDYRRLFNQPAGDHRWSAEVRSYYTTPPTDPRYRQLAERIINERLPAQMRRDPFSQAVAIKQWLDHELTYSIRERHANVPDPTIDFLFGNRTGYCVHFAHSAVFLWRSLGIPSRISTGYHSDAENRDGLTLTLRGKDAHAWPELYIDGYGWIVLDIAAERVINEPPNGGSGEDHRQSRIPTPLALVVLDTDYSPPTGNYYFRQQVWSQRDGARLVTSTRTDVDGDISRAYPTGTVRVRDAAPSQGRTLVEAQVSTLVDQPTPFALESPITYSSADNPNPERFVRSYRFTSLAQTVDYRRLVGLRAGDPRWSPEVRAYYTAAPEDPRYLELAQRVVREQLPPSRASDPFAQALAIKLWMDHELTYSSAARHTGEADPTSEFLFGNHQGYSIHFAHAAVYLWRSLGIPARVSAGYRYAESNRHGGSALLIRATDEQAWPELYLDGYGWVVLDLTPERNLDPPDDAVDEELQRMLGEMARRMPHDPDQRDRRRGGSLRYGRIVGWGLLSVIGLLVAVMYLVKLWRRLAPLFAGARSMPRVGYRKALDLLSEAGLSREFGETREHFAERVRDVAPSFARLTEMHMAAALGDPSLDPTGRETFSLPKWRGLLRDVAREIPKGTKRWRRVLGFVNPASWLDAR